MLEMKHIKVNYGEFVALDMGRDIIVDAHDIVGIVGSNGAGKSTLIKALTNQVAYTGKIVKPGQIAVHLQENNYPAIVTCRTILEGLLQTTYKKDPKLIALVQFFDFEKNLKKKVAQLSGGQKQRLTIIMVLYQDAPLTCFDELSTGLDFETRFNLMAKIKAWYANKPAMILLITHYFDELEKLANKLLIIDQGHVVDYDLATMLFAKYVGYSAVVVDAPQLAITLPKGCDIIRGEAGQTVIGCDNQNSQQLVIAHLNQHGFTFSATRTSVTLIYLNALHQREINRLGQTS